MAVKLDKKISLKDLLDEDMKSIKDFSFLTKREFGKIGNMIVEQIVDRTRNEGKDINDKDFKGYAPSYKKIRQEKGLQTSYVDLTDTQNLLDRIEIKRADKTGITIAVNKADEGKFRGAHEGVYVGKGQKKKVKRPFFGLSPKDVQKLQPEVADIIINAYDRALRSGKV